MSGKGPAEPREAPFAAEPIGAGGTSNGALSIATDEVPGVSLLDADIHPEIAAPPRRLLVWEQMLDVLNLAFNHHGSESAIEPNGTATIGDAVKADLHGPRQTDGDGSGRAATHNDPVADDVAAVAVREGAALRDDPALLETVSELVRASKRGHNR
jgi:hypothetical protein